MDFSIFKNKPQLVIATVLIIFGIITAGYLLTNHSQYRTTSTTTTPTPSTSSIPIKHIIIIFQENHAFDNFFGTFPNATGIPAGVCMPINTSNSSSGCVMSWLNTNAVDAGAGHSWQTSHIAYDNGAMDGFIMAAKGDKKHNYSVLSYYSNLTIPNYWALAHHYVLDDHMFSSVLSYSQPNHWYEIAGQAPNISLYEGVCGNVGPDPRTACEYNHANAIDPVTQTGHVYLTEADNITTLADTLQAKDISWVYYGAVSASCHCANGVPATYQQSTSTGIAFDYWFPLMAQNRSFSAPRITHLAQTARIFSDINNGNLANISWISPPFSLSDHPPANITIGSWYVTSIVDSVMQSRYWNSTAIIVMWDDYGGYFDTIAPPQIDANGLSFRVPSIVISPYSKVNYVDHSTYCFESTMKLIEYIYNLPNLTRRDSLNSVCGNMLNSFDFAQRPGKPYIIGLNSTQNSVVSSFLGINNGGLNAGTEIRQMIANLTQDPTLLAAFNDSQVSSDSTATNYTSNMNNDIFNNTSYGLNYNVSISVGYKIVNGTVMPIDITQPASWFVT